MYQDRSIYRSWQKEGILKTFQVVDEETDLLISAESDLSEISLNCVKQIRQTLKSFILDNPSFKDALIPLDLTSSNTLIDLMLKSAKLANVGPMASVAGAVNELLFQELHKYSNEIIIENGGDILISGFGEKVIGLYAGEKSPFTGKLGIKVDVMGVLGVCTSSGTVGHSLSFGKADSVTVVCNSCALADAYATSLCNQIKEEQNINDVLAFVNNTEDIIGCLITMNDKIGATGEIELVIN